MLIPNHEFISTQTTGFTRLTRQRPPRPPTRQECFYEVRRILQPPSRETVDNYYGCPFARYSVDDYYGCPEVAPAPDPREEKGWPCEQVEDIGAGLGAGLERTESAGTEETVPVSGRFGALKSIDGGHLVSKSLVGAPLSTFTVR